MKKSILILAGVVAASAVVPEASALPVFSRQVGRACSACHFQHFPLLNSYGRDFKASGYTLMGSQGKVKDDHLSIPNVLNLGALTTTRYDSVSAPAGAVKPPKWNVPGSGGELSIFFGGRIADFAGFLSELGMTGVAGAAAVGAAKLPMLFPVGDYRIGPVIMTTNGQGMAHSFELLNTGAANTHKVSAYGGTGGAGGGVKASGNHVQVTSAAQFFGTNTAATGISLVAANTSFGYINIGKYEAAGVGTPGAGSLPLTYARIAGLFGVGSWDIGVGIQNWSGSSFMLNGVAGLVPVDYKATVVDGQLQGELAGMPFGLYASYGRAPGNAINGNAFNSGGTAGVAGLTTSAATSFNVTAELGVIPRGTIVLALRSAKVGATAGITNLNDNAVMIGATYELAQNVELSLTHTSNSGSAWDGSALAAHGTGAAQAVGKTETNFMLEALF
ncbi:MAG TPA: hypothetical protein VFK88_06260 [Gallionella sp.]|nr:hypothetical protein [Gallionella sp.]